MTGTKVVATDLDAGESDECVIVNDYVLITNGTCRADIQMYANGTHIITIKGRRLTFTADEVNEAQQ